MTARISSPVPVLVLALGLTSVVLGVVAGFDPRVAVGLAFGVAFVALVFQSLTVGVCLMAVLAFLDAVPALGGALSLAKVAGLVLGASWLALLLTRSHQDLLSRHPVLTYAIVLFLGWTAMSIAWAEDRAMAIDAVTRYAPNLLLIPIAYSAIRTSKDVRWLLGALLGGALFTAVLAIAGPASDPAAVDVARAEGLAGGANELAASLVVGLVLALAFAARTERATITRAALLAGAAVCALGIFLSLSRGGLVALGAALLAGVIVGGRWRRRVAISALTVVALGLAYFSLLATLPAKERVTEIGGGGTGRTDLWTVGWRMVEDRPLLGVGAGNFPVASIHYLLQPGAIARDDFIITTPKVAHNTPLQVLAETGVPGAVLFLGIVAFSLSSLLSAARRFERSGDIRMELLARGALVALIGYLVAALFISENYSKLLWLLLALGPALLGVAQRAESSSS